MQALQALLSWFSYRAQPWCGKGCSRACLMPACGARKLCCLHRPVKVWLKFRNFTVIFSESLIPYPQEKTYELFRADYIPKYVSRIDWLLMRSLDWPSITMRPCDMTYACCTAFKQRVTSCSINNIDVFSLNIFFNKT